MRERLSSLLVEAAKNDPKVIILTGDHGYQLFDELRRVRPEQFLNCGVAEQGMVGIAAGLASQGFKPIVYGLAAFIPMRTLEQIKLDVCFTNLPVVFLGDGAGLVYSTLGASHHCSEDIAVLRPLPNISIYSPCDATEMERSFKEALALKGPSYIRIGKGDRPSCSSPQAKDYQFQFTVPTTSEDFALVSTGSMVAVCTEIAEDFKIDCISVRRIKPVPDVLLACLGVFRTLIVVEEHSKHGGLYSMIAEQFADRPGPRIHSIALKDKFADKCGSWQFALSEHGLDDSSIRRKVNEIVNLS